MNVKAGYGYAEHFKKTRELRLKRSKVKKDDGILQYTSENAIIAKVS
jgi:hypothetical protein